MKRMKTYSLITCLFVVCSAFGRDIESILSQREVQQSIYRLKIGVTQAVVLPMSYGSHQVISEADKDKIRKADVLSIDLVYSDFPKGQDLTALNRLRINELQKLRRELVTDERITWKTIRQMSCQNEEEAQVLFHGVVIHFRTKQSEAASEMDVKSISTLPETGDELMKLVRKDLPFGVKLMDSTVVKVLDRNKNWKEMVVVSDLTGSMSPYVVQLLVWFQLRLKDDRVRKVLFFNDGDLTPDEKKKIGQTGGIYVASSTKYEDVLISAKQTVNAGGGGDAPENNCEALLKAIEVHPEAKELILVADNFAPIKDFALASKIKIPVRIILCGAEFGKINEQYLNLARKTGGSLHTMQQDLVDLVKKNEGDKIQIGKQTYQLRSGVFIPIMAL